MKLESEIMQYANGESYREVARRVGMNVSTLINHLRQTPPEPLTLIKIARAYDVAPLQLLYTAGILTGDEILHSVEKPLSAFSDRELAAEILRRAGRREDDTGGEE